MTKHLHRFILLLFLSSLISGCSLPQHTKSLSTILKEHDLESESQYDYRCTIGAHRGASDKHVENSFDALIEANVNDKYDFIELDVQYSSDGKIVVFHDQRLIRQFYNFSSIGNSTFAELSEISNGEIATYDEVIPLLDKKLNIEIKSQGKLNDDKRLVDEIIADLIARDRIEDVAISSISTEVITYVKQTYPEIPTGQIFWIVSSTYMHFDMLTQRLYDDINASKADYIMLYVANLRNIDDLVKLKPKGKTLVFWDFDDIMFVVHTSSSDRIWGNSYISTVCKTIHFKFCSLFQ